MSCLSAAGSTGAPGTSKEDGRQQHAQIVAPASGTVALARQLAQAKLSEAELQQRLRYGSICQDLLAWCGLPNLSGKVRNSLKICMCHC